MYAFAECLTHSNEVRNCVLFSLVDISAHQRCDGIMSEYQVKGGAHQNARCARYLGGCAPRANALPPLAPLAQRSPAQSAARALLAYAAQARTCGSALSASARKIREATARAPAPTRGTPGPFAPGPFGPPHNRYARLRGGPFVPPANPPRFLRTPRPALARVAALACCVRSGAARPPP